MAWVFPSEIFPYRARAKTTTTLVGSGVLKVTLRDQYRKSGCFLVFSLLSSLSLLVVYVAIPETKGVMLEDMEELFRVDPKAYCCGCLPELNSGLLGLRVLKESQKALNKLVANTSDSRGVGHGSSVDPENEEDEELFVPSLFGTSSQTTPQSQQLSSSSSAAIARFSTSNSNSKNAPNSSYDNIKGSKRTDS
eukprot:gene27959-36827_t